MIDDRRSILKIKKLKENAVTPTYATDGSLGLDLTAISKTKQYHPREGYLQYISYGVGLACEIPCGYVGLVFPRSSVSNKNLSLANAVGVIDQDFRGEISFRFRKLNDGSNNEYEIGDKIGQLVVIPCPKMNIEIVDELSDTIRGSGGYGSTNQT